jgi:NADH-quinone oxidoreductase subunit H
LFYALAVVSVGVLSMLMAGWASANKYALLGGMRAGAQLMAYELPLVLAASSVAMAAGTLSLGGIVQSWSWWWLPYQGVAAFVFFAAALAELRRAPFDMPVADSEIIFGPFTEYTGMRFAIFLMSEYAGVVVFSALAATLFLGGWKGPFLDHQLGWLWLTVKTLALSFVVIWLRVSYPRLREDQLQRFAWIVLVPLALGQLLLTGVVEVVRA